MSVLPICRLLGFNAVQRMRSSASVVIGGTFDDPLGGANGPSAPSSEGTAKIVINMTGAHPLHGNITLLHGVGIFAACRIGLEGTAYISGLIQHPSTHRIDSLQV